MHGIDPEHIVPTGAPCYDQWFMRGPSTTREEFCQKWDCCRTSPFAVYLCSSQFIAPREADFVKRWVQALRSATDPRVRQQHSRAPASTQRYESMKRFDLAEFPNVVLWPAEATNPVDASSKNDYFDSLPLGGRRRHQHERPDRSRDRGDRSSRFAPEYVATQEGTLHFHYLLTEHGGLVHLAETLEEHARAVSVPSIFRRKTSASCGISSRGSCVQAVSTCPLHRCSPMRSSRQVSCA